VWNRRTLDSCLEQLGKQLLGADDVKAVMMSKDDSGDVLITLVEGREDSHKVRFGRVDSKTKALVRNERKGRRDQNGHALGAADQTGRAADLQA